MTDHVDQQVQSRTCPDCGLNLESAEDCPRCAVLRPGDTPELATAPSLLLLPPPVQGTGYAPQNFQPLPPPLAYPGTQEQPAGKPVESIVVAVLVLIGAFFGMISFLSGIRNCMTSSSSMPMPIDQFHVLGLVTLIMGLVKMSAETIFGIGLLQLMPWARKATIYGLIALCFLFCSTQLYSMSAMSKPMKQMMTTTMAPTTTPGTPGSPSEPSPANIAQLILTLSSVLSVIFPVFYTGLLIFLLCRPGVVQAFGD